MRPAGEIRLVVVRALRAHGPMAAIDLAQRTQVGREALQTTLENMVRHGALEIVGSEKRDHSKRWVSLYDVPQPAVAHGFGGGAAALGSVIGSAWR